MLESQTPNLRTAGCSSEGVSVLGRVSESCLEESSFLIGEFPRVCCEVAQGCVVGPNTCVLHRRSETVELV